MKNFLFLSFILFLVSCAKDSENIQPITDQTVFEPLFVSIDWDNTFEYSGVLYTYCASIDIDVFVYNEFNQEITNFAAARSNCPEEFQLNEDIDNGSYTLFLNAYNHLEFSEFGIDPLEVPVTIQLNRGDLEHSSIIDSISTNDSIWQVRDQRQILIEAGTITKSDTGFEWKVVGEDKVVF